MIVLQGDAHEPLLTFGEALWDITAEGRTPGGAPANVALHLAALGVDVRLLTRVGDDALGRALTAWLAGTGLGIDHVQLDRELPTGRVHVDASDPLDVNYKIAAPAAWDRIDSDAFLETAGKSPATVVFGSLATRHEVSRASLLALLERAELRIFDANLRPPFDGRDIIERLLRHSDWVKLNEQELVRICGWTGIPEDEPATAGARLRARYGLEALCITLGARGALLIDADGLHIQPGFAVPVIDTIGCGDAFLAAWLAEVLRGAGAQDALLKACAAGALVATQSGASGAVSPDAIEALIATAG